MWVWSRSVPNTHSKCVDILIKSIQQCNRLDDVIVILLHRELYLCPGVSVTQTQLRAVHIALLQLLEKLGAMKPQSTKQILDDLVRLAVDTGKGNFDGTSQILVGDTKDNLFLLAALGKVDFEERFQVVAGDCLGDVVRIFKGLSCASDCFSQLRQWRGKEKEKKGSGREGARLTGTAQRRQVEQSYRTSTDPELLPEPL